MGHARIASILLFAAMLMILSCASSMRLTDHWKDPSYAAPTYKKIMVVSLTKQIDVRHALEKELAEQLKKYGIEVAACYECISDTDKLTGQELMKAGKGLGIEAYLIIRLLRVGTRVNSFPEESPSIMLEDFSQNDLFGLSLDTPAQPLSKRVEVATLEARLYDGKTVRTVWRAVVEAVNLSGSENQISRFSRLVVKTLDKEKLIPSSRS